MGSILPLVEIRLRMGPRSTVVARTFNGPGRVKIGITASAASTPTTSQVRPLRVAGRPFELLLVPANQLSFGSYLSAHGEDNCKHQFTTAAAASGCRFPKPLPV